jgi:hypothetical protein
MEIPSGSSCTAVWARFMKSVYAWTAAGVASTAATAGLLGHSPEAVTALREAPGSRVMWPALAMLALACGTRLHQLGARGPPAWRSSASRRCSGRRWRGSGR